MNANDSEEGADLPATTDQYGLPSPETLASMIAGTDRPDARTMAIARATHSRLVTKALSKAPTCSSCRHHTVFCRSVPVLHCMHPAIARTTRDTAHGHTTISSEHCESERKDWGIDSPGRVTLCGVEGRLHEPLALPWLFGVTRALIRKAIAQW